MRSVKFYAKQNRTYKETGNNLCRQSEHPKLQLRSLGLVNNKKILCPIRTSNMDLVHDEKTSELIGFCYRTAEPVQ